MRRIALISLIISTFISALSSQTEYGGLRIPYDPCSPCSGSNINYNATSYFDQPNQVASDFGPRYVERRNRPDTPYDWHGGIDYNGYVGDGEGDYGFHLRAIVGGTIYSISTAGGLKLIVIDGADHDFGYLHMFNDDIPSPTNREIQVGDCKFVRLDGNAARFGILIPDNGQYRLLAECPNNNCNARTYTYTESGIPHTLTATNQVVANDIIGALGNSGQVGAHLHLNRYESLNNCNSFGNCDEYMLNPLEYVEHTGVNYSNTFHNHSTVQIDPSNEPQGFNTTNITYPGTNSSTIMVRPQLAGGGDNNHYTTGTFNIRDVNLEIKESYATDYRQLIGNKYESRLILGATDFYSQDYPNYLNITSVNSRGGWAHQGIYNFAYREATNPHGGPYNTMGGKPYDDFYFPFYHRLHKNSPINGGNLIFAYIPYDARYIDGIYDIKARVTDVRNAYNDITTSIIIDNFQPFITDFKVKKNPIQVYDHFHLTRKQEIDPKEPNSGTLTIEKPVDSFVGLLANELTMEINSSEPLTSATMYYRNASNPGEPVNLDWGTAHVMSGNADNTIWTKNFEVTTSENKEFKFGGQDVSGNALMDIYTMTNSHYSNSPVKIPVRQSQANPGSTSPQWTNLNIIPNHIVGQDYLDLYIECGSRIQGLRQDDIAEERGPDICDNLVNVEEYTFSDAAQCNTEIGLLNANEFNIGWKNEGGEYIAGDHVRYITEPGIYCYRLENYDGCCNREGCFYIDNILGIEPESSFTNCEGATIDLKINASEYGITWSKNGVAMPRSAGYPKIMNLASAEYCYTVQHKSSDCTISDCINITNEAEHLNINASTSFDCNTYTYDITIGSNDIQGGLHGFLFVEWF